MTLRNRKKRDGSTTWFIDYQDLSGRRRRKVLKHCRSQKMAEIAFGEFARQRELGEMGMPTRDNLTLEECLEAYVTSKSADCVKSHVDNLKARQTEATDFFGADLPVKALRRIEADKFKLELIERGNSAPTVNKKIGLLRSAFSQAVRDGLIAVNPLVGVEKLSDRRTEDPWRWLREEEIERLLSVMQHGVKVKVQRGNGRDYVIHTKPSPELYSLTFFLLNTGARRGEALAVTWNDLDFENNHVRLVGTKKAARGRKAHVRYIPLNKALRAHLLSLPRSDQDQRVFKITEHNLLTKFLRACSLAGIGHCRVHDLRHTFASLLAKAGTPILTIKELLGHSTLDMTLRYAHLCPSLKTEAVERLELSGPVKGAAAVEDVAA